MHILACDMFLLLLLLLREIPLQLLRVFVELHEMLIEPFLDLHGKDVPVFVPRGLLRFFADLKQETEHHRIVRRLAGCVRRGRVRRGVRLYLLDERGEIGQGGDGRGGQLCLDGLQAGEQDLVARDLGRESAYVHFAVLALFVYVALFPSDEGFLVYVGVALDIGVIGELPAGG